MLKPVQFNQAYWYTHQCPLRKLDNEVFPESDSALKLREYIHDTLLEVFDIESETIAIKEILSTLNIEAEKRGIGINVFARRIQQILVNYGIWKTKHLNSTTTIASGISEITNDMQFDVDLARLKNDGSRIQLIWYRYDTILPSLENFAKLIERAQWNARGYELFTNDIPMFLTYYFPVIGSDFSVLYNTENKYNIISELINKEVFYAKPSAICDVCTMCPMSWIGYISDKK